MPIVVAPSTERLVARAGLKRRTEGNSDYSIGVRKSGGAPLTPIATLSSRRNERYALRAYEGFTADHTPTSRIGKSCQDLLAPCWTKLEATKCSCLQTLIGALLATENHGVGGSIPPLGTIMKSLKKFA
jgi:hypothetical protein